MPIFLLIRHAETDYNKKSRIASRLPGVHLNQKGKQQAQQLADKLANAPIKAIHSSPLERAIETAEPLARVLNLEIVPNPGLLESDCGEWQGKSVKNLQRQKIWQSVQQRPSLFHFPGGEWIGECQHRMVQVLETLRPNYSPQDLVVCFSHADPIKQLIAYYLGLPLDNYQRLSIDLASITALQITESGARLFVLNYNPAFSGEFFQPPQKGKRRAAVKP